MIGKEEEGPNTAYVYSYLKLLLCIFDEMSLGDNTHYNCANVHQIYTNSSLFEAVAAAMSASPPRKQRGQPSASWVREHCIVRLGIPTVSIHTS